MRRSSKKRAALDRQTRSARDEYRTEFHLCMRCNRRLATDLHEIARGIHREEATKHPEAWLLLCLWCHEEMGDYSRWPLARQLALKLVADPTRFDLAKINEIRGRAEGAIDLADVGKYLELK